MKQPLAKLLIELIDRCATGWGPLLTVAGFFLFACFLTGMSLFGRIISFPRWLFRARTPLRRKKAPVDWN